MKTISPIEQEVDQIRLRMYEITKGMTPEQLTEYYKQSTEATIEKYGLRLVANTKQLSRPTCE